MECPLVVQRGWSQPLTGNPMRQVNMKILATSNTLRDWQKGVFQHRLTEINLVRSKLDSIMHLPFNQMQYAQQQDLNKQLQVLLSHNEMNRRQRSRICWLKDGDRNTAFFIRKPVIEELGIVSLV